MYYVVLKENDFAQKNSTIQTFHTNKTCNNDNKQRIFIINKNRIKLTNYTINTIKN